MHQERRRIGLLYPTPDSGEDDFTRLAEMVSPAVDLRVVYFPWPDVGTDLADLDTDAKYDLVRRLGSDVHLRTAIPDALSGQPPMDAVAFAVTSASFLHGRDGVAAQLRTLSALAGCPATSTTSAFQQAVRSLRVRRVALASVYHPEASDHFVDRINDTGVEVVHRVDADAPSDRALAAWSNEAIVDFVGTAVHPDAQMVLLPETALHTTGLAPRLDAAAGVPVLTATQVTLWSAYRLAGLRPVADSCGVLYA